MRGGLTASPHFRADFLIACPPPPLIVRPNRHDAPTEREDRMSDTTDRLHGCQGLSLVRRYQVHALGALAVTVSLVPCALYFASGAPALAGPQLMTTDRMQVSIDGSRDAIPLAMLDPNLEATVVASGFSQPI